MRFHYLWVVLACSTGLAAAKPAPVREAGSQWTMAPGPESCALVTTVAGGTTIGSIKIALDAKTGAISGIRLEMKDRAPAGNYKVGVKVDGAAPHAIDAQRETMPSGDVMFPMFSNEERAGIAAGKGVLIGLPGETIIVGTFALRNRWPQAMACSRADYARGLKSPPDLSRIVTWSKPVVPLFALFGSADYPRRSFQSPNEGLVQVVARIGVDGRVSDCVAAKTSHANDLDWTACEIMKARARYEPALDATGKKVESVDRIAIRWLMPDR